MDESNDNKNKSADSSETAKTDAANTPLWGKALEDMYAAIVDEPLPQSFLDLLDKLAEQPSPGPRSDDRK
jgi:Anti-sigma factor NepR